MVSFLVFIYIYFIGGITFLPCLAIAFYIYIRGLPATKLRENFNSDTYVTKDPDIVKKGWIRLINQYQPKMPEVVQQNNSNNDSGIISGIQSYVNVQNAKEQKKGVVYAVLKHATLFCYESEKQENVVFILPLQEFQISLYPPNKADKSEGSIYGRMSAIRLVPNSLVSTLVEEDEEEIIKKYTLLSEEDITAHPSRVMYLSCGRNIDKEDWYLELIEAQHLTNDEKYVMMDSTHFDAVAMEELIRQVQSSPSHRETAWLNAIFGRLFLGMYKTDRLKNFIECKIRKKIVKTKRPTFLDEISVRNVHIGESVPFITDPKLLSLSTQGEVIVESKVEYRGGLTIEIETDFNWSYSSRLKPIRMHLILAVKLKQMSGRMMFKIKAPPTNRYWLAFFEMPDMEWEITPIVADKQIKLSLVTNAIESRIREVMTDSFVLPNMDDTSFCPSNGKGGIFGEYVKVERRASKETTFVNNDSCKSDLEHSRTSSGSSTKNNIIIREPPIGPDVVPTAADALKLKNRRAESAKEFALTGQPPNPNQKLGISQSTPALAEPFQLLSAAQHQDGDQKSISDSINSINSKWSAAGIRKRLSKSIHEEEANNNTETITSSSIRNSGILSKISNLLPTDNKDTASSSETKKPTLIQRAEYFIAKNANGSQDHLSVEKKETYAERLASMRKRAEKRNSVSSISSNGSSTFIPPPPLPPLPSTSSNIQQKDSSNEDIVLLQTPPSPPSLPVKPPHSRSSSSVAQPPLPPRHTYAAGPVSVSADEHLVLTALHNSVSNDEEDPVLSDEELMSSHTVPILTEEGHILTTFPESSTEGPFEKPLSPAIQKRPGSPNPDQVSADNEGTNLMELEEVRPVLPNVQRPAPPTYKEEESVQSPPALPPRGHITPALPPRHL